jgi:ATP-binding cassette subfamily C (CFTR/MRP) protein 1
MLESIVRAPLLFFDTTPIGRLLSRFSKDIDILDVQLPELISDGVYCFFEVTKTTATTTTTTFQLTIVHIKR